MSFFKKIFDHEYKELEKFKKIADEIMELDPVISKLTDKELKGKTKEFKELCIKLKNENQLINISNNIEKSFILIKENKKCKAYISNFSIETLEKRINMKNKN